MDEGFKRMLMQADGGDIEAMVMVADCYNRGLKVEKNDSKAHLYYQKAADMGHPRAAFMASLDWLTGMGTRKSKPNAIKYMQFAADKGVVNAQYMLGTLYKSGEAGFLFKEQKAAYYLEMAAKRGHAKAQIALGDMNIAGKGAQFSLEKGLFWLVCAYLHGSNAQEESDEAMRRLNALLQGGLPGGIKRVDQIVTSVKAKHPSYIRNPNK